ncbi:ACT domain-containing protein [Actinidia chinensis var. chinensis]|uniref:ACT domain-containing protein ACR n=1 Tax=Actinidia chinensis var. chinensis TaxID=1590841 RepID=A0A2R6RTC6_ACTCC|nr:ACT domain-containing protein [Actinidia chinensis var. chinensis]
MGIPWDDVVLIQQGKKPGDPSVITVNCPDKAGLGCDLCRIVVDFGLSITKGDFCTDGNWCYIVLWTIPQPSSWRVDWESLKTRLQSACPSCLMSFYFNQQSNGSRTSTWYMLKMFCVDRKGLLHDVTKALCQLELTIQRVKVMTTPDDKVLDLFFITDNMDLLHTKQRREDTCERLSIVLGEDCINCELHLALPEYESQQGFSSLSEAVAEELFSSELSNKKACSQDLKPDMKKIKTAMIMVDNFMSPAHTLLQIQCVDQKNLVYDILRTAKDCNIQIAYGRISPSLEGRRNMDLFIQKADGKKIIDPDNQTALCSRLKEEILHPLRVTIANRGPDTELLVANPAELSGKGRPRVFYDVTVALKMLGICVFSAEIGRHSTSDREWEVYRFLLDESLEFPLASARAKSEIVDRVRRTLMGW